MATTVRTPIFEGRALFQGLIQKERNHPARSQETNAGRKGVPSAGSQGSSERGAASKRGRLNSPARPSPIPTSARPNRARPSRRGVGEVGRARAPGSPSLPTNASRKSRRPAFWCLSTATRDLFSGPRARAASRRAACGARLAAARPAEKTSPAWRSSISFSAKMTLM